MFFLTDMDPFEPTGMHALQMNENIMGKKEEHGRDDKSKASVAGTIMLQIKEKERFIKDTFKNVQTRSEIFFKFTGYSYKLAAAWKLTLSSQKPLLPFSNHYECVVLPKKPKDSSEGGSDTFDLWMITKQGFYKRIKFNKEISLDIQTTQLSLQFNSLDKKIILSVLTKNHYTTLEIGRQTKCCDFIPIEDYSF